MIFQVEISNQADTEKAVVTIIRVMYGGRDIDTQLKQYTSFFR